MNPIMNHCWLPFKLICCFLFTGFLLSTAQPAGAQTLEGMVIDAERNPVADARVWISQNRQVQTTQTDQKGAFTFSDLDIAYTTVIAYKKDQALSGWSGLYSSDMPVLLIMRPAATLTMRLIDRRYNPVPGVRIRSMLVDDQFFVPVEDLADHGFPLIRSDDEGHLDIPMFHDHGFAQLILTHIDHADTRVSHLPVREARQNIVLSQGILLRGRVSVGGEGIERARVSVFRLTQEGNNEYADLLSDQEGYFQVRLPSGEYFVRAYHKDFASPGPVTATLLNPEETTEITVPLVSPRIIQGRVLLPESRPAPGVLVRYRSTDGVIDEVLTDLKGHFELHVARGEGVLRVNAPPGYLTAVLAEIPVNLETSAQVHVNDILLESLPVLEGVVLDETGVPVADALVQTLNLPFPIWVFTDEEGTYKLPLDYVPDYEDIVLRAEHPLRFLRHDFKVNLANLQNESVELRFYEPHDVQIMENIGGNNLQFLMNEVAPEITCEEWFNTPPVSKEKLQGKVIVLTFWGGFDDSDWNRIRMEELKAYYRLLKDADDVVFLNIHDSSSDPEDIEMYLYQFGIPFGCGRDAEPFVTFVEYGINFIPQTVLIDKEGVFRYYQTEGRLLELIKALRRRG